MPGYSDLPSAEERGIIWKIYIRKYGASGEPPDDVGWSGNDMTDRCNNRIDPQTRCPASTQGAAHQRARKIRETGTGYLI
ncbi:MAG: hypothetical protein ACYDA9_18060 [Terriglobia bacterium]